MILVYQTTDRYSNREKELYIDTTALKDMSDESILSEMRAQGIVPEQTEIVLNMAATLKGLIFSPIMTDKELLGLTRLYIKAKKVNMDASRFETLWAKSNIKSVRKVGEIIHAFPDLANQKIMLLPLPKYAKGVFKKVETSSQQSGLDILKTLQKILTVKNDIDKKIRKLVRYPKMLYGLLTAVFIGLSLYVIPEFKEIISSLNPDNSNIPYISRVVYDISTFAQANKTLFIIYTIISSIVFYILFYRVISFLVRRIPFIAKVSFYRDHSLFFGLLSTLMKAGMSEIDSFISAASVISDGKRRDKMRHIIEDMNLDAIDFATGLKKYNYSKEISEVIDANKGLNASDVYAEMEVEYTDEMQERVEAAAEFVQPFALIMVVLFIGLIFGSAVAPLAQTMSKLTSGGIGGF